jgi:putative membrane protein
MKKNLIFLISVVFSFGLAAQTVPPQNNEGNRRTNSPGQEDQRSSGNNQASSWNKDDINKFVKDAALGSMMEIQLGKLAQQKAASSDVKNFGQMMVENHTAASQKLKDVAGKLNITLPSTLDEEHLKKVKEFQDLQGEAFDKKYMDFMVKDHKEDLSEFEKAQKNVTSQNDLKSWIDNTLPVLRKHLETAQNTEEEVRESD